MEITTITTERTTKFLKEIAINENFWNVWTSSPACFLNDQEFTIINGFILTGDHYYSCMLLNIPYDKAVVIFQNCKRRITWCYHVYRKWLTESLLEDNQLINQVSDLEVFLHSPIEKLPIEHFLKRKLMQLCDTIYDVLSNYSEKDLKGIRGFGRKKLKDFKLLLMENNCMHLLK